MSAPLPAWKKVKTFQDIVYEKADGIAKVTINRPHKRNAFTPDTVSELIAAFRDAWDDTSVGVVLLTGFNPQTGFASASWTTSVRPVRKPASQYPR